MATRNIVPNNDSEGNIGSVIKKWIKGWFVDVYVSGNITDGTDSVTVNQLANPPASGDLLSTNNLSDVADAATSLSNLSGEPAFSKNTAFNKDFGTIAGTVLEGDKNAAIVLNTAKVTNATHIGEVTGSGSLTVDPTAISNKASVTAAAGMEVLVNDAGTLKKANASDFLGSGGVFTPTINGTNMVEVSQESDFGTAVGSVITLTANTTYFIRGNVNCSNRLLIDTADIAIIGWDRDKDGLTYTSSGGDFITIDDVNCEIANIKLSSTNVTGGETVLRAVNYNAPDYNAGRDKVLTIINCQIRNCYDVWYIEGFDLVDIQNTLVWYVQATTIGCQFKNVSKLQLSSCEFVRWFDETSIPTPSGYATTPMIELLANGGGSGFGAVNINGAIIHPQQTQVGIDIDTTSTTGFGTISSSALINVGLTTGKVFLPEIPVVLLPDYSQTATYNFDVFANQGILNSTSGIVSTVSSNATATTVSAVYADVNTGASATTAPAVRFTASTAGIVTYNGTKQIYCSIHASLTLDSGGNDDTYTVGIFKDDGGGYALLPGSEVEVQFDGTGGFSLDVGTIAINYGTLFSNGDAVKMQIKSTGASASVTVTDYQLVIRE